MISLRYFRRIARNKKFMRNLTDKTLLRQTAERLVRSRQEREGEAQPNSATGTRTRVARVRAEYPNQLDYGGADGEIWSHTCEQPKLVDWWEGDCQDTNQKLGRYSREFSSGLSAQLWSCCMIAKLRCEFRSVQCPS